jgi:hypothetical protein
MNYILGFLLLSCSKSTLALQPIVAATTSMSTTDDAAAAFNQYASCAVELSNAHATNHLLTVIRSVRDIDNNKRRKLCTIFLSRQVQMHHPLLSILFRRVN